MDLPPAGIKKYKTEPYVIAADVYAVENHEGMGGWTWYTGSAGWMYQLLAESFFGEKNRKPAHHQTLYTRWLEFI